MDVYTSKSNKTSRIRKFLRFIKSRELLEIKFVNTEIYVYIHFQLEVDLVGRPGVSHSFLGWTRKFYVVRPQIYNFGQSPSRLPRVTANWSNPPVNSNQIPQKYTTYTYLYAHIRNPQMEEHRKQKFYLTYRGIEFAQQAYLILCRTYSIFVYLCIQIREILSNGAN